MDDPSYEKLGAFYVGRRFDLDSGEVTPETILYDSKDLTTHAVCVGMTGSGKTGLGVLLLEEAAIDGVPAIVIDPKGDLGNLLLQFPELRPSDFEPWVDPAEAARQGRSPAQQAVSVAKTWKEGLASWGQDGERIRRLQGAAEVAIYTPGSASGRALSLLGSFDPPPPEVLEDAEALSDRVQGATAGLLALLGSSVDPERSREGVLLANLLQHAWTAGRSLGLSDLIREVQKPPFERLGVLELESFFPAEDRFDLAMSLNALVASPSFGAWLEGEPLDVARLLVAPDGRPRVAVLSIAHLSESERMFFVTVLLNEVLSWIRTQPGTSSLRALLYMDEIFGYFPPTAQPPSKRPMLTLLKQARAYGLGVILATQNPVDLDYKGLANTGTWFLGRLQTERDKQRVLDGLQGALTTAGAGFDRGQLDRMLSGLGKRVFLLHNVHEREPVLFQTRWALSYLRGPLTRAQVRSLCADAPEAATKQLGSTKQRAAAHAAAATAPPAPERPGRPERDRGGLRPPRRPRAPRRPTGLPPVGVLQRPRAPRLRAPQARPLGGALLLRPAGGRGSAGRLGGGGRQRGRGRTLRIDDEPEPGVAFADLPSCVSGQREFARLAKDLKSYLYRERRLTLWKNREFKLLSKPDESEAAFRGRVALAAREDRDLDLEKVKASYGKKLDRLRERVRKAEERVDREEDQYSQRKKDTLVSFGTSLLGALLGRKKVSSTNARRAGTVMRSAGRASKEKSDIERAERELEAREEDLAELQREFEDAVGELEEPVRAEELELEPVEVAPRKSDLDVGAPRLVWEPWRVDGNGIATPPSR